MPLGSCVARYAALRGAVSIPWCRSVRLATDSSVSFIDAVAIVQQQGAALFGLKPALLRQASYQGVKMLLYEPFATPSCGTAKDGDRQSFGR